MPCYHPIKAWYGNQLTKNGKRSIKFKYEPGDTEIELKCGQCYGCREEQARQWALRIHHDRDWETRH